MSSENEKRWIGIDYSMSSPSVTILGNDDLFVNAKSFYMTSVQKNVGKFQNIEGTFFKSYKHPIERYMQIANWVIKCVNPTIYDSVFIEDYSMGSKGKTFHIAENTSILKYTLFNIGVNYETIPPTVIKKYATSKGNSDKEKMYSAFLQKNNLDLREVLKQNASSKVASPLSDIVDSYYIALTGKYMQ